MSSLVAIGAGVVIGKLFDNGLSNSLCVESLRHGTNPISHVWIRLFGGDPNWGGSDIGSTAATQIISSTKKYFYIFKDTAFSPKAPFASKKPDIWEKIGTSRLMLRYLPRAHVLLSGFCLVTKILCQPHCSKNKVIRYVGMFLGALGGVASLVVTPILKFRVSKIDPTRFVEDHSYSGGAYKTAQKLEPWRLGILGSLLTGVNADWFERVKANPLKLATGLVQLIAFVALFLLMPHLRKDSLFVPYVLGFLLS